MNKDIKYWITYLERVINDIELLAIEEIINSEDGHFRVVACDFFFDPISQNVYINYISKGYRYKMSYGSKKDKYYNWTSSSYSTGEIKEAIAGTGLKWLNSILKDDDKGKQIYDILNKFIEEHDNTKDSPSLNEIEDEFCKDIKSSKGIKYTYKTSYI